MQVRRTGDIDGACSVEYATADVTATAGSDYAAEQGLLSFAPGEKAKTITVKVLDDDVVEEDEIFEIHLKRVVSGDAALHLTQSVTRIEIVNDDFPGVLVLPCEDFHVRQPLPFDSATTSGVDASPCLLFPCLLSC